MFSMRWIRDRRKELKMSQDELAQQLQLLGVDVTRGSVGHWETGHARPPLDNPEFVAAFSKALRLDINTILRNAGYSVITEHSIHGEQAAILVDQLPEDKKQLAIRLLEQLAKS